MDVYLVVVEILVRVHTSPVERKEQCEEASWRCGAVSCIGLTSRRDATAQQRAQLFIALIKQPSQLVQEPCCASKDQHQGTGCAARFKKAVLLATQNKKAKFEKTHPCPSTGRTPEACPDYVVDHIRPLKRGGADRPENMQWQTREAAKQMDKTE
jgi:hypothetical protein